MSNLFYKAAVTFPGSRTAAIAPHVWNSTVTRENDVIVISHHNFINSENFMGQFGYEFKIRKGSALELFLKTNAMPNTFTVRTALDHHTSNQSFTKFNIRWSSGTLEPIYSQLTGNCRTFLRQSSLYTTK
jgi:hypothetical protein